MSFLKIIQKLNISQKTPKNQTQINKMKFSGKKV